MIIAFRVMLFLILLIISMKIMNSNLENNFGKVELLRGAIENEENW